MMKSTAGGKGKLGLNPARYLFILPAFLTYCIVLIYPAFYSLILSFFKWNGVADTKTFVGLSNYIYLFTQDSVFMTALRNNFVWMVMTICITVVLAFLFAMIINMRFPGRTFLRSVLYFPYIMSGVMVALTWKWIYHPQLGLLNNLLKSIGKPEWMIPVLSNTGTAFVAVFIAGCWHFVGGPMLLFLAGLQTLPQELIDAAYIDGANKAQTLFRIKIPLLSETFFIVLATQIIASLKVYDVIYAMTGGGPAQSTQTLSTWMITQTFSYTNLGIGTAIAWIMVLIMLFIIVPYVSHMAKN